jgi:hypothetical protein
MVSTGEVGGYVGDAVGVGDFAERKVRPGGYALLELGPKWVQREKGGE